MTTAIEASSAPAATASMIACRLLPRPEIRTPRRGREPTSGSRWGREPTYASKSRGGREPTQALDKITASRRQTWPVVCDDHSVMPRRRRIGMAGIPHHVMNRASRRSIIFAVDEDYSTFEDLLIVAARRFEMRVCD